MPLLLFAVLGVTGLISRQATPLETSLPPEVKLVEVGRFEEPVHITSPPGDTRLFVVERKGRVWVVAGGRRLLRPFLDISDRVDNPFVGRAGRDEIWAYGLRNPWRFGFDPATGALVIGDVGQVRIEEIDIAPRPGLNFGWPCLEGNEPFNPLAPSSAPGSCRDLVPPALAVTRSPIAEVEPTDVDPTVTRGRPRARVRFTPGEGACTIVVGVAIRDPALPGLAGCQLYGDFCNPTLRSFRVESGRVVDPRTLGVKAFVLSSFGVDAAGRVYATTLSGSVYLLGAP